jgi:hypothetical protein
MGYGLWVNLIQRAAPHLADGGGVRAAGDGHGCYGLRRRSLSRAVALQVAFEMQTLKPAFPLDRL